MKEFFEKVTIKGRTFHPFAVEATFVSPTQHVADMQNTRMLNPLPFSLHNFERVSNKGPWDVLPRRQ
jgi:hypothetical protein